MPGFVLSPPAWQRSHDLGHVVVLQERFHLPQRGRPSGPLLSHPQRLRLAVELGLRDVAPSRLVGARHHVDYLSGSPIPYARPHLSEFGREVALCARGSSRATPLRSLAGRGVVQLILEPFLCLRQLSPELNALCVRRPSQGAPDTLILTQRFFCLFHVASQPRNHFI